jgi:hypothetical protein
MMDYPSDREDMPTVILAPGQAVAVRFANTDGEFVIAFDCDSSNELTIEADMPDSDGREGVIYREVFSVPGDKDEVCQEVAPEDALADEIVEQMNEYDRRNYTRKSWVNYVEIMCSDGNHKDSETVLNHLDEILLGRW